MAVAREPSYAGPSNTVRRRRNHQRFGSCHSRHHGLVGELRRGWRSQRELPPEQDSPMIVTPAERPSIRRQHDRGSLLSVLTCGLILPHVATHMRGRHAVLDPRPELPGCARGQSRRSPHARHQLGDVRRRRPVPEDIKVALQVLTTLGKANMKGPFGETDAAETKPTISRRGGARGAVARARQYGRALRAQGQGQMKQLVDLGWTDRAVAKAMGVRDNAVRQHRLARSLPPGKVWPTPEEVEFRIA